eukprot:GABU01004908.1.p1 GENE.GABU01004908.1~~GABU01004908.1.p1  ORF type:complete len:182 (+),score=18.09 GABU01004908.1:189-734(+)
MHRFLSSNSSTRSRMPRLWRSFSSIRDLRLIHFKELPSTHTLCQKLLPLVHASDDSRLDICVVADRQTRGLTSKAGHAWKHESDASLAASLGMSIRLSTQKSLQVAPFLQFLVGYALVNGLKDLYQVEDLALKWPNDLYYREHKCGGILESLLPAPQKEAKSRFLVESTQQYFEGVTQALS